MTVRISSVYYFQVYHDGSAVLTDFRWANDRAGSGSGMQGIFFQVVHVAKGYSLELSCMFVPECILPEICVS